MLIFFMASLGEVDVIGRNVIEKIHCIRFLTSKQYHFESNIDMRWQYKENHLERLSLEAVLSFQPLLSEVWFTND